MSPEERSRLLRRVPSKAKKAPMVTQTSQYDTLVQPINWT